MNTGSGMSCLALAAVGLVTEAGLRDMPIGESIAMTGHRTVATLQGYYQSAAIRRSKVASMLDTPPPKDA